MIEETLQALSADIVLADTSDSEALAEIRRQLDKVAELAAGGSRGDVADMARSSAALLTEAREQGIDELDSALAAVGRAIASMQELLLVEGTFGPEEAAEKPVDTGIAARDGLQADPTLDELLQDQVDALEDLEAIVLRLESGDDYEALDVLRGRLHTLKGDTGILDLAEVSALCHRLEDLIEEHPVSDVASVLLDGIDWIRKSLQAAREGDELPAPFAIPDLDASTPVAELPEAAEEIAPPIVEGVEGAEGAEGAEVGNQSPPAYDVAGLLEPVDLTGDPELVSDFIGEASEHLERVDDQLLALERDARDAEALNSVFRAFHTIKGLALFLELGCVQHLSHEAETMLDMARSGKLQLAGEPLAITFEVNDALKGMVRQVEQALASGRPLVPEPVLVGLMGKVRAVIAGERPSRPASAQAPAARGVPAEAPSSVQPSSVQKAAPARKPAADEAARKAADNDDRADKAGASDEGAAKAAHVVRETIKVDAGRLDELVDTIGELVIAEAMVSQCDELDLEGAMRLPGLLTRMDKITRELQEMAMSLRMVPVRGTFRRMARLARDVATKTGKKIEFVTRGEDTELDKTVVDSIGDPLVHLIRNAVDHGIESDPEARRAAGKPPVGRIELRAFHQGGSIYVEIADDGGGLDKERILAKARDRGIVTDSESLSDSEIYGLIFSPGFSTAATVTDVSGRGVGLDVVKRNIEALRGAVETRSEPGHGTVFRIRLPLTLAIIEGMIVRVGDERYIFPMVSIVRMVRPDENRITRVCERGVLLKDGDALVPMLRIDELFEIDGAVQDPGQASAVIVEHGGRPSAFLVDEILGQQQIVIKPLGPALAGTPGLAGGAIMPDGQVGLILDIASLIQLGNGE